MIANLTVPVAELQKYVMIYVLAMHICHMAKISLSQQGV